MTLKERIQATVAALEPEIVDLLQRLVRIPSLPGNEAPAHALVADYLRTLGLDVEVVQPSLAELAGHPAFSDDGLPVETRPNVVGRWRGANPAAGRSLILNGHLDVVAIGDERRWSHGAWSGEVVGRCLYGRGACDMKAGVTAAIFAVSALQRAGIRPAGDLLIETVSGEESGGIGTLATIVGGYRANAAVILEPTALSLCPLQAGALTFRLIVPGRAAHGALKRSGVSAVDNLRVLLDAIDVLETERERVFRTSARAAAVSNTAAGNRAAYPDDQPIAPISVGVVRAGEWPSTVPESAFAEGRFGVYPGESLDEARNQLEGTVSKAAAAHPWLRTHPPEVKWFEGQFEPGETPANSPIVLTLAAAHREIVGKDAAVRGVPYGSDLRLFTNHAGMPAILYGPGHVEHAHAVDEFVDLDEVLTATEVIALAICGWCESV